MNFVVRVTNTYRSRRSQKRKWKLPSDEIAGVPIGVIEEFQTPKLGDRRSVWDEPKPTPRTKKENPSLIQLETVNDTRDSGPGNTADTNLDSHK